MDPNANIEEQRAIVARMMRAYDAATDTAGEDMTPHITYDAMRLAELVQALDGWLCSGGFLPRTWESAK